MRSRFDRDLKDLNDQLVAMGKLLEEALADTKAILQNQDEETLERIISSEKQVDELERDIQTRVFRILCSQQPVARDLRAISTALNMITDMERISDQTVDISEIAMFFKGKTMIKKPVHIMEMIDKCIVMVNKSIDSFVLSDVELAEKVIASDDEVDSLFIHVREEIITLINNDRNNGEQAIDFMMIAKYLERIADHAVNIGEWVIFNATGEHKNNSLM